MAEKTILVCDACGKPAAETVTIKVERGNFVKDLCATHVNELVAGARKPRPGRRKGSTAAATAARATVGRKTGRKTAARKTTGRKRGRPRKAAAA
jgi:topoisomerase IA-like protein